MEDVIESHLSFVARNRHGYNQYTNRGTYVCPECEQKYTNLGGGVICNHCEPVSYDSD